MFDTCGELFVDQLILPDDKAAEAFDSATEETIYELAKEALFDSETDHSVYAEKCISLILEELKNFPALDEKKINSMKYLVSTWFEVKIDAVEEDLSWEMADAYNDYVYSGYASYY